MYPGKKGATQGHQGCVHMQTRGLDWLGMMGSCRRSPTTQPGAPLQGGEACLPPAPQHAHAPGFSCAAAAGPVP